eukprot:4213675-Pleurochrysis_carterae.AAC.1
MPAVYIAFAFLHYSQRVPHRSNNTLKRLAVALTRKGKVGSIGSCGKRAVGLLEDLCLCVNQRWSNLEWKNLSTAEADHGLLLRWISIPFSETIFEALIEPSPAVGSAESCPTTPRGVSHVQLGESSRPIGGKVDTLPSNGGSRD